MSSTTTTTTKQSKLRASVYLRIRPNLFEVESKAGVCVTSNTELTQATLVDSNANNIRTTRFDRVFPTSCAQKEIFECIGLPAVKDVISGTNYTILAYGHTGTGKTYTIQGNQQVQGSISDGSQKSANNVNSGWF